jgi:transcriptional regulator with XRE-family HTH domain
MARNRIFALRKAGKLTQRELAERAGTSQQQIQRVEAGVVAVRLDLAGRIADALNVKLHDAFPALRTSTKPSGRKKEQLDAPELAFDLDPRIWTVRFFTFDGREFGFEVSSYDMQRLESIVSSSNKKFLVFNSRDRSVAVNRTKLAACQFLFDSPLVRHPESESDSCAVHLHLASSLKPLSFDVEPDTKPAEQDEEGFASQLQHLFIDLDGIDEDDDEVVQFDDVDGERVYARSGELVLVEAPLECCEPSLFEKAMEGDAEEGETVKRSSSESEKPEP